MASFNRVVLLGNLTRDVDFKHLPSGMAVADLGLAMNERRKTQSGEWVDEPVYVDVTLWGRTAEVASEYLSKGSPVLIEGRLKYETWEKEGKKFSKLKIVGERMQLVGARGAGGGGGPSGGSRGGRSAEYGGAPDDGDFGIPADSGSGGGQRYSSGSAGRSAPQEPEADIPF